MFNRFLHTHFRVLLTVLLSACLQVGNVNAEEVTVNFRDTEIENVVESIAELTGGTFIIDPRVKGKMTIVSPDPVDADLLYEIFLSALQVHGFQGVNDGAATRIVPLSRSINVPVGAAGNEITTEVISLRYIAANELVPILKPLMSQGAHLGAHPASNKIVITDSKAQVRRIKEILRDMDNADQKGFDIIPLNHSSAGDVVTIAREMGILTGQSKVVEDTSANRIIVSGPRSSRQQLRALVEELDTATSDNSGIDVIYLNYSEAENIQPVLEAMLKSKAFLKLSGEGSNQQDANAYTIQADKENNALIIAAPTGVTTAIKSIISKLDKPRSQVLIEAVIAEVSESFLREFNANVAVAGHYGGAISDLSGVGALSSLIGIALEGNDVDSTDIANSGLAGLNPSFGGGYYDAQDGAFGALISALKGDGRNKLLSTPSILTLENEEALISIGQEIPVSTGSFTSSAGSNTNPFTTTSREEVGTILKVKPQINEGDAIRLEVNQEVSGVNEVASGLLSDTVTDKKIIETNVIVSDGEILVLGGLIDRNYRDSKSRVPILGDIPLLGNLFRSSSRNTDATVLMVFIRPTILRNAEDARKVTESKYKVLQERTDSFIERHDLKKHVLPLPKTLDNLNSIDDLFIEAE